MPRVVAPPAGAWIETFSDGRSYVKSPSPPLRGRGLKQDVTQSFLSAYLVAPPAGAWIETLKEEKHVYYNSSPPLRGRGLKHTSRGCGGLGYPSPPPAGAWIETSLSGSQKSNLTVAPPAGAWIETVDKLFDLYNVESPPLRGRGLKRQHDRILGLLRSRPPCGGVD